VPLPSPVTAVLKTHRSGQAAERLAALVWAPWEGHEDLVFPTKIGTPSDPRNTLRAFAAIAQRAGLPGVGLHTLRHSAASALIASGAPTRSFVVRHHRGHLQPCSH
jgi:integrase